MQWFSLTITDFSELNMHKLIGSFAFFNACLIAHWDKHTPSWRKHLWQIKESQTISFCITHAHTLLRALCFLVCVLLNRPSPWWFITMTFSFPYKSWHRLFVCVAASRSLEVCSTRSSWMPSCQSCVCACAQLRVWGCDCLYNKQQYRQLRVVHQPFIFVFKDGSLLDQHKMVNQAAFTGSMLTGLHKEISVSRGQYKVERFTIIEERRLCRKCFLLDFFAWFYI